MTLHYTDGPAADIAKAGFNLADVSYVSQLNALPEGMKGLVWVGNNVGATTAFQSLVRPFINHPKLYGFRLGDEPDITGRYKPRTDPAHLMAESDYIHETCPGAKTFVTLMDMGPYEASTFANTYNYANTHIDLFGIDPYPVRLLDNGTTIYDINFIDRMVKAALDSGIELERIVPVFQAFGGGNWSVYTAGQRGKYKFPTAAQTKEMFERWAKLVPNPEMDFAYIWMVKEGHMSLGGTSAAELEIRELYRLHNTYVPPVVVEPPPPEPSKYAAIAQTLRTLAEQFESL
ncbi:hypothetical protein [Mesorhizobium wenxiniae]|uniref:hypothetical protein n=1 Tax=Mesorhizobium wenxiniae TaxID=2014805 RepID=UPI001981D490|nr:hypothetical protein [Mesorhizobium wenxiniae]